MPVYGTLIAMSLKDLLHWAGLAHKTGVLELERNRICRRIEFREGMISACSSDDPPSRLGQFLLARGKITRENLREGLERQESTQENLGTILVRAEAITEEDLAEAVSAKAEETIQGLFEWEDAVFRFYEDANLEPHPIAVSLSVNDVLVKGLQRQQELGRYRKAFPSSGVVLTRTDRSIPDEIQRRPMAMRIVEAIDGRRSISEILLRAHASEFLVVKLMYYLLQLGLVEAAEEAQPAPDSATILDPSRTSESLTLEGLEMSSLGTDGEGGAAETAEDGSRPGPAVEAEVEVAQRLMSRGEHAAALELLNAAYRAHPGENHLRRLIFKAESEYIERVRGQQLSKDSVPVVQPVEPGDEGELTSEESFLLSLIDGASDIKSILWLAPMREVEALKTLQQLAESGRIAFAEPAEEPATPPQPEPAAAFDIE